MAGRAFVFGMVSRCGRTSCKRPMPDELSLDQRRYRVRDCASGDRPGFRDAEETG